MGCCLVKKLKFDKKQRIQALKIHSIPESKYETQEKCEEKVDEVFNEKLGLYNIYIEYAHHVKRGKKDKSTKPRTIVHNLPSFKEKKLVLKKAKKLKSTNIYTDGNICPETMEYCTQLWEKVKELRRKGKGNTANLKVKVILQILTINQQ